MEAGCAVERRQILQRQIRLVFVPPQKTVEDNTHSIVTACFLWWPLCKE